MSSKNQGFRWKLNVFDVIIMAVVLVAAAALIIVWRNSGRSNISVMESRPVRYRIEINGMVPDSAIAIESGDLIYDSVKKYALGTVQDVTLEPARRLSKDMETGRTILAEIPDRLTAVIDVVCDCYDSESTVSTTSGYTLRVGQNVFVAGPGYAGSGYIVSILREDVES
ncbi:MAG TPA: DUF4330 family protein [Papillibacter sp.]|jgi:hypothetical protein|nr:DUF4330 family protein [Papillibacter sp.]